LGSVIAWFPASTSLVHASTRIRAHAPWQWLRANTNLPIKDCWENGGETAVVFKRPDMVLKLRPHYNRIIYDISDNHFGLGIGMDVACMMADIVVCSTAHLLLEALRYNSRCEIIPDCIDPIIDKPLPRDPIPGRLLWFGCWGSKLHDTGGMSDILTIADALNECGGELVVCSNSYERFYEISRQISIPMRYSDWSPEAIRLQLSRAAITVLPVTDTPFTRCKSHNRVTTAIAASCPVIASKHPSYDQFGCSVNGNSWSKAIASGGFTVRQDALAPYRIERIGMLWAELLSGLTKN
jgi:hypothetical protein